MNVEENEEYLEKTDYLDTLSVNKLRWKLYKRGLEVDGSREAMYD